MSTDEAVIPVFIDRCHPRCSSKRGKRCTYLNFRTFNHHHFGRHFMDERENKGILKEFTGRVILLCAHPACLTKVKKLPKSFATAHEMMLHLIKDHFGEEEQKVIYKLIDERLPIREEELKEDEEFPDDVSFRSQITDYSRASHSAVPMQTEMNTFTPFFSGIPEVPALRPLIRAQDLGLSMRINSVCLMIKWLLQTLTVFESKPFAMELIT